MDAKYLQEVANRFWEDLVGYKICRANDRATYEHVVEGATLKLKIPLPGFPERLVLAVPMNGANSVSFILETEGIRQVREMLSGLPSPAH